MWKMKKPKSVVLLLIMVFIVSIFMLSGCGGGSTAEEASTWTLVNPEGVQLIEPIELNEHPSSLEGKTVALRWNGKENGNLFLDSVAEQLQKSIKDINIIKLYETMPETNDYGPSKMGPDIIDKVAALEPDLM